MKAILGKKVGMTQVFTATGEAVPVTVIEAGPCFVSQVKLPEKDGYSAVQLAFEEVKPQRISGGEKGHLKRNNLPALRSLREVRTGKEDTYEEGQRVLADTFAVGERVDVIGISKGRGFAGVMRRHGFKGGPATHGQSDRQRSPGGISSTTFPGRIWKGHRMAGHMGRDRVSAQNLRIELVDAERNLLAVRGSVPGAAGDLVLIKQARKSKEMTKPRGG